MNYYVYTGRSDQSASVQVIAHLECAIVAAVVDVTVRVELVTSSAVVVRRLLSKRHQIK
jgi:hypothetical protein